MKTKLLLSAFLGIMLCSCSTSNIAVSDQLSQNSVIMDVKGNAGILINQRISFGGFSTSPIKRGWTQSTDLQVFGITHSKAFQPIEFTQFSPKGLSAEIMGASNYNNNEFDLFKGLETYVDNYTNNFYGVIFPQDKKISIWKVYVENDSSGTALKSETDNGFGVNEEGEKIEIRGTKRLAVNKFLTDDTKTFGFELVRNGESFCAVSVINNGKVWMKNNLSPEDQLIASSIASI